MATETICTKLTSLITLPVASVTANPAKNTEAFRVDGVSGSSCVVVEVSGDGIVLEMRDMRSPKPRRMDAPKGLSFRALAFMIEQGANGLLF